jgi:hypothetical protein
MAREHKKASTQIDIWQKITNFIRERVLYWPKLRTVSELISYLEASFFDKLLPVPEVTL